MTAALVAAQAGARTLLVEKTMQVGGTTARSGGAVWIPGNHQQDALERASDAQAALRYLDALIGERGDRALRETFIERGPEMLSYLEERTGVRFAIAPDEPDYRQTSRPLRSAVARCARSSSTAACWARTSSASRLRCPSSWCSARSW